MRGLKRPSLLIETAVAVAVGILVAITNLPH
jgi:hypothetical protein